MAINFPSTAGQPTNGTYTYTVAGITYSWNGESWVAAGAGASAVDTTVFSVTQNPASGSGTLSYATATGQFTYTPPLLSNFLTAESDTLQSVTGRGATTNVSLTLTNTLNVNSQFQLNSAQFVIAGDSPSSGNVSLGNYTGTGSLLVRCGQSQRMDLTDQSGSTTFASISNTSASFNGTLTAGGLTYPSSNGILNQVLTSTGTGSVVWSTISGLQSRTTASVTAVGLGAGSSTDLTIVTPKTYALHKIETNVAAWVTLYTDTTSRTNDQGRSENTDPLPGSGVIAEVITAGATTQLITPGVIGFNSTGSNATYTKIVNKSGGSTNVTVTLHFVQLEA